MTTNTTNSQAPEILAKQVAEWRKEVARLNDLIAHAEGRDSQAASILSHEFTDLMYAWAISKDGTPECAKSWVAIIDHIDAKLAQTWNDGDAAGMTMMRETIQKSLCDEFGVPHIEGPEQTYIMVEAAIKEKMEALLIRAECAEECFAKLTASDNEWRDRANVLEARLGEVMNKRDELRERAEAADAKLAEWDRIVETSLAQDYATRAIAAESRLAEIQRGVEGLQGYDKARILVAYADVIALLQPQGQADTSGLPG